jgi:hypothetical protein
MMAKLTALCGSRCAEITCVTDGGTAPPGAAQAPADATLVIYHSSVLYQVAPDRREQFAGTVRGLGAAWLSSEAPGVLPGTAAPALDDQMCVLARDGRVIAYADSHGTSQWLHA